MSFIESANNADLEIPRGTDGLERFLQTINSKFAETRSSKSLAKAALKVF